MARYRPICAWSPTIEGNHRNGLNHCQIEFVRLQYPQGNRNNYVKERHWAEQIQTSLSYTVVSKVKMQGDCGKIHLFKSDSRALKSPTDPQAFPVNCKITLCSNSQSKYPLEDRAEVEGPEQQ
jgi:hypothetical protein